MNVRCDIRTTKAHSIISQISNYEIYISNYFDIMQYSVEADLSFCRRDRLGAGAATPCRQALHSQVRLVDQAPLGSLPHQPPHRAAHHAGGVVKQLSVQGCVCGPGHRTLT